MRLPIATSIESRDGTLTKDAKLVNCFVDVEGETSFVVKRPGLRKSVASAAGTGLGMVSWEGNMYHAVGSTFYQTDYASIPSGGSSAPTGSIDLLGNTGRSVGPFALSANSASIFSFANDPDIGDWLVTRSSNGTVYSSVVPNWAGGFAPGYNTPASIFVGSTLYFTCGEYLYSSPDVGSNFTKIGDVPWSPSSNAQKLFVHNGTNFVMYMGGVVRTSSNFATWTTVHTGSGNFASGVSFAYLSGKYYLISETSGGPVCYTSTDLTTWTPTTLSSIGGNYNYTAAVASNGTSLIVVSYNASAPGTRMLWAMDAATLALTSIGSYSVSNPAGTWNVSVFSGNMIFAGSVGDIYKVTFSAGTSYATPPYSYAFTTATPGLPLSWVGTSPGTYTKKMFIKNEEKAWTLTLGTPGVLTQVTDTDYPAKTVPGAVYLDGYFFVMDKDGTVYNCDLENPDSWNALNYITAEAEWDKGVAIAKHQNYVVALKDWTCELFYDAANPTGSPLSKVSNATVQIGCAQGYSTVQFHGGLIFMSKTRERGRSVHFFPPNSIDPQEIASASIQRILNAADLTTVRAWGGKLGGRILYVLNLVTANITLVYDFTSQTWAQWTSDNAGTEGYFKYGFYATDGNRDFLLHETTGEIFTFTPDVYQDNGADIKVLIRTGRLDAGNMDRKTMSQLTIVGDKSATSVSVQQSDDDYQTFSTARTVAMNAEPPRLLRLGMFRRRSFDIRHVDNTPLRLAAIDAEIQQAR